MIEPIILQYAGQAVYVTGGLVIGYLWRSLKTSRRDYSLIKAGVCALLRDRLRHRMEKCLDGGYCTVEAMDDIEHMYSIYVMLGGNGTVKLLMTKIKRLPSSPPQEDEHG